MGFDVLGKKGRKFSKSVRRKLGITSHNKLGRALKHVQHLFKSSNSATSYSSGGSSVSLQGYTHTGKSISQLVGGV